MLSNIIETPLMVHTDSGCSRHMTREKSSVSKHDYKEGKLIGIWRKQ